MSIFVLRKPEKVYPLVTKKIDLKTKELIYLVLLILSCTGCKGPEELSFERTDYLGGNIKFNGFYYNASDYEYFIFYQNGVYHTAFAAEMNVDWIEDYYADPVNFEGVEDLPYFWGAFRESSINNIEMEGWLSSDGGGGYPLYSQTGEIISASTILIGEETFSFIPLVIKPDSVLSWINN